MSDCNKVYAPVMITTCNRYEHLKACLESLQKNAHASETELFIGLDYPPSDEYEDGYNKIENYLDRGISGFKKVNILKRKHNLGPYKNERDLENLIMKKYDRWIFSEDDNVFSTDFLDYMNYYLELYKNDASIFSVCGHTYPKEETFFKEKTGHIFARYGLNAWGYGVWRDKWQDAKNTISGEWIETMVKKTGYIGSFKMPKRIKHNLAARFLNDDWELYDTTLTFYLWLCNKYQIFPSSKKVKNNGFDGLGEHSPDDKSRNEGTFKNAAESFLTSESDNMFNVVGKDYYSLFYYYDFSFKWEFVYLLMYLLGFKKARSVLQRLRMI